MALIAAQMYTLRKQCQTPADIAKACAKVKKMGYDGVQLSAGIGEFDPVEMKRILDGEGLKCTATHYAFDRMEKETDLMIERHQLWECQYPAIGGYFPEVRTRASFLEFATRFNAVAKKFAAAGMVFGYHNHHFEFMKSEGYRLIDLLINYLDPEVWIELDTHWVARGGADPATYIEKVAGRIPCVHFKDMSIKMTEDKDFIPQMCEIGDGNLNWPRIVEACRYAGVKWYIVERDEGELDPFDSLERSIFNMREKMGL